MKSFQQTQYAFTAYLRSPDSTAIPGAIEERRMVIYRDLIYNNIENFIAGAFPVIRRLYDDSAWHSLVRDFIERHQATTPYFLEISQEFLAYLWRQRGTLASDPPFLMELAHYEWVELALDVAEDELPAKGTFPENLRDAYPRVSPLVMNLAYHYPVHKISPGFRPDKTEQTFLLVYRNSQDEVKFMESNALTHRLLYLLQEQPHHPLKTILSQIVDELAHPDPAQLFFNAENLVRDLYHLDIISFGQ